MTKILQTGGMGSIRFKFNERKAVAMAALLLKLAGGETPYMRLIKLMYLAERASLAQHNRPICGDRYFAMKYGPVLSTVLNLIKGLITSSTWSSHFDRNDNSARLVSDPGVGALSQAEIKLITEIDQIYKQLDRWHLSELSHSLPEWKDPGTSRHEIAPETILKALGKTEEDIEQIRDDARERDYFDGIFGR